MGVAITVGALRKAFSATLNIRGIWRRKKRWKVSIVIQTEELDLSALQAVEAYKDLSEIERSFRELKDLVEMRPIYHRRPKRVRAHIFVAALAFLLARALEKKLKAAKVPMSSAQALEALRTIHVVDIRVGKEIRRGVTAGNHQARQILAALGISDREPLQTQSSEKMPA